MAGNQFAGFIGKGQRKSNEREMGILLNDTKSLKKKHSRNKESSLQSSQEYQNVQMALDNLVFNIGKNFTNDVAGNEKMVTTAMGAYYKLLAACEAYIAKPGGKSLSGRARKNKVKEIQAYAQRDLMGVQQVYFAMKDMSGQEQSSLNWDEIIHSARADMLEMDELSAGGSGATKTAYMTKDGVFFPETKALIKDSLRMNAFSASMHGMSEEMKNKEINATNRNVATSNVANLLGAGHLIEQSRNIVITEKTGKDKKTRKGIMMTKARGTEFSKLKPEFYERKHKDGQKMKDISTVKGREALAKKVTDPNLQKEFSTIQVIDYICGQGDRHTSNYFLESKGERFTGVHGIDNDMAFSDGVDLQKTMMGNQGTFAGDNILKTRMVVDSENNLVIPHMDYQLAMNILNIKPDEFRYVLKGLVEPEFIECAVLRLKKVQIGIEREMRKGKSDVFVKDGEWNEKTHNDFMNASRMKKLIQFRQKEAREKGKELSEEEVFLQGNSMDNLTPKQKYEMVHQDSMYSDYISNLMGFDPITGRWGTDMNKALLR